MSEPPLIDEGADTDQVPPVDGVAQIADPPIAVTATAAERRADRRRFVAMLLRWGFPLVSLGSVLASQILLPSILQRRLSSDEYTAYVAVTSLAAYLGLADAGVLISTIRELSALHGAGDRARFAGEAQRARKVFIATGLVGCVVAAIALSSSLGAAEKAWGGATSLTFRASVVEVILATALTMSLGSYHTALLFSTGRLLAGQIIALLATIVPLVPLVAGLVLTRDLAAGLHVYAGTTATLALWRGWDAHRIRRRECAGVTPAAPPRSLRHILTTGIAFKIADVLPTSAYPHLLAVEAEKLVPTAVPARTYANGCRIIPQQFLNLLQVHTTRRMAGSPDERARGEREYRESAVLLCTLHLIELAAAALLAQAVFGIWLPARAPHVALYLPGLFAEQALLAAALPCTVLLTARGWLLTLGIVRAVGVLLGLGVFAGLLSVYPEAAFGIGFAVSAVPLFGLGVWVELRPPAGFPRPDWRTAARYALGLAAAASCVFYSGRQLLVGLVLLACGLPLAPVSVRGIWRLLRAARAPQKASS